MKGRAGTHLGLSEDGGDLDYCVYVVGTVEEGEAFGEDGEQYDAGGPDVDFYLLLVENSGGGKWGRTGGLVGTLKQHLWSSEPTGASTIRTAGRARVVFWVALGQGGR